MKQFLKWVLGKTKLKFMLDQYIEGKIKAYFEKNFQYFLNKARWEENLLTGNKYLDKKISQSSTIRCYTDSLLGELIYLEKFEEEETKFVSSYLNTGDIFIDVGANIGLFSLIASERVGLEGHVYAFEPHPITCNRLMENVSINNFTSVSIIPKALSDKASILSFFSYKDRMDAFNSFAPILENYSYDKIDVEAIKLSDFLNELSENVRRKIKLVKIDVEGWEIPVLKGAIDFFSSPNAPAILVEFTENNAKVAGFSCQELYDLGVNLGYTWHLIRGDKLIKASPNLDFTYINLVGIK